MKKTMITALALLLAAAAGAQDTVDGLFMGDNYFCNYRLEPTDRVFYSNTSGLYYGEGGVEAKYFDCGKDTLKIVGVAVPLATWQDWYPEITVTPSSHLYYQHHHTNDTALSSSYEYVGIYKHEGDSMRRIDSVMVNRGLDTATHILIPENNRSEYREVMFYLYEKRFANPIVMTDSFYVGLTQHTADFRVDTVREEIRWERLQLFSLLYFTESLKVWESEQQAWYGKGEWMFSYSRPDYKNGIYYFFPIVEPYGDTLSVQTVERFTSLFPNPATGRVSVFSSFGLNSVRLYSVSGAEVLRREGLSGTLATLELGALPAGTYLVHIDTPAGTAVKRLVVSY